MKNRLLFIVALLTLSSSLSANEIAQSNSAQSQSKQEALATKQENSHLVVSGADNIQIADTGDLSQIRQNTEKTAVNTEKGRYERWTIILSGMAFVTAFVTLIFAIRTYISQKKTQRNTIPKANKKIQRYLLDELIVRLFEGHMRLTALWYLLNEKEYQYYPSEQILRRTKLPSDTIFTYLFYTEDDEKEKNIDKNQIDYQTVQGFSEMLDDYNMSIEELAEHLKNKSTPQELLYIEFHDLLDTNDKIATMWGKVMTLLFMYNDKMKSTIFEVLLDKYATERSIEENDLTDSCFYKPDEVYPKYLIQEDSKKKLLTFMEKRTASFKKEFDFYLIERN